MAKKMIRPLRSETDYNAALDEIERYFENEPRPGTPEADRFDLLALIIEDYERQHWPILLLRSGRLDKGALRFYLGISIKSLTRRYAVT